MEFNRQEPNLSFLCTLVTALAIVLNSRFSFRFGCALIYVKSSWFHFPMVVKVPNVRLYYWLVRSCTEMFNSKEANSSFTI